jgi:predicted Zn-dependent peptidase
MGNIRILLVLVCLFFGDSFISTAQETALKIETYELENGLKIYLNEDPNASNVYGAVWVNAGGKNDPANATGIAHYLEHMLFKGTQELGTQNYELEKPHLETIRRLYEALAIETDPSKKQVIQAKINEEEGKAAKFAVPNEFDRLIKSIGSSGVNASTSEDYTNYYNFFPANQLPKWLDIYAHRFQKPVFRLFQSELEAVYEEKNRAADDMQNKIFEKFSSYIYGDHPYSTQTVIGSVAHLKNPSLSKMYDFFQNYYVANNMALVLCGNFDAAYVKPMIEKTFGKLKSGVVPEFKTYVPNTFKGRELKKVRITPIKVGFMGHKLVPRNHTDHTALAVLGEMISNSDQTGFIDQLSLDNKVYAAGALQDFMEEDGSSFIYYVPKVFGKSLNYFEELIKSGFQSIADGNFDEGYFQSIKTGMRRNFNQSLESLETRGYYLGLSFIYNTDYQNFLSFPEKVQKTSKEKLQAVASKYYGENYFTMQSRMGFPKKNKLKKPPYNPISARTEKTSEYAKKFDQLPEKELKPTFIALGEDLRQIDGYMYYTKNPLNNIFTLELNIAAGLIKDPLYPELAMALNNTGTFKYSINELKKKFSSIGATYSFNAGYNSFDISLTGLDENFEESLALLEHLIDSFNPTEKTISILYNNRKTKNKLNENDPSSAGSVLYLYGLFGEKSGYLKRIPVKELKKLAPKTLKDKLNNLVANGFNAIHYVGKNTEEASLGLLKAKPLFKKNITDTNTFTEAKEVTQTTIYVVHDKKAIQSYVYYIVNGSPLNPADDYKKEAFNAYYTNGLSGLLFQEVREFRSLAYATGGDYIDPVYEPNKKGRLVLFTGSQADKTSEAVSVVMGLINDMPSYTKRLEAIKNGLLLESISSKPDFRKMSVRANQFLNTGYTSDPNELNYLKYPTLTFQDIVSFYEENIKGKPAVITIYGDSKEFDMDVLKKFGKVVLLKMEDILIE